MNLSRKKKREILLQILFSIDQFHHEIMNDDRPIVLIIDLLRLSRSNIPKIHKDVQQITPRLEKIDEILQQSSLDYSLDRISIVNRNILRIAICELLYEGLDPKIVIHESIRLTKKFSSIESSSFIHAIIDSVISIIKNKETSKIMYTKFNDHQTLFY